MCSTEDYINWKFEGIGKSIMSEEHFFDQSMVIILLLISYLEE